MYINRRNGLILLAGLVLFGLIQLIPYGHDHTNPPVIQEPNWDSPTTRDLARRACFDCHSNETIWYWYTGIAPFSWLIQNDAEEGRYVLNFSEWGRGAIEVNEISEAVLEGNMPPASYLLLHPPARLNGAEIQALVNGLNATVKR